MKTVWQVVRLEFRAAGRRFVASAIIVALVLGLALGAASGARRTDSAFARMLQVYPGPDVIIPNLPDPTHSTAVFDPRMVRSIPGVEVVGASEPLLMSIGGQPTVCVAHVEAGLGGPGLLPYKILSGRQPNQARLDEVIANYVAAQRLHLSLGETLPLRLVPPFDRLVGGPGVTLPREVHIVGIYAGPSEVFADEQATPALHFTAAFARLYPPFVTPSVLVGLRRGRAAVPSFLSQLERRAHGLRVQVLVAHAADATRQHAVHTEALAVWLLAGLVSLTGSLIVLQTLVRQLHVEGTTDDPTLSALGLTHGQLFAKTMARSLVLLLGGAIGAVGIMYLLSPLLPVGIARLADPHPGFAFDPTVALLGAASFVVFAVLVIAPAAWFVTAARRSPLTQGSVVDAALGPASHRGRVWGRGPITAVLGARLAFERRRGANALPTRTTIGSMIVAVSGLTAALVFASSLNHLLATPITYGLTWDATLGSPTTDARSVGGVLLADHRVAGLAFGVTGIAFEVNGHGVDAELLDPPVKGKRGTVVLSGHAPMGSGELALGTRTMQDLHLRIGDHVTAGVAGAPAAPMVIVGRVVLVPPASANEAVSTLALGDGALATYSGIAAVSPRAIPPAQALVRLTPGVRRDATLNGLASALGSDFSAFRFVSPDDIVTIGLLQDLPLILAGVLGAMAALTLLHVLLAGLSRRRRELAVLRTLGLARAQILSTVIWQGEWLVSISLVLGLAIGIVGAHWLWDRLTTGIGLTSTPVISVPSLAVAVFAIAFLASLIGAGPGLIASRTRPATVLRSE